MKNILILLFVSLFLTSCATWDGVKKDSKEAWETTKEVSSDAYDSTKKAINKATE